SKRNVMPVVEMPMTSHAPARTSRSSARWGGALQQFGSKTLTVTPADSSTPARRQTPSGGARKVYSPQFGSYGPTSSIRGECMLEFLLLDCRRHARIVGLQQPCRQARQPLHRAAASQHEVQRVT